MQRMFQSVLAVIVIAGVTGCSSPSKQREKAQEAEKKEAPAQQMTLSQVPEPARATIVKLTAAGKIKKIEKAEENGKTVYDVEATVQGRDVEYDIAADGTVLTTEQSVPYASLPLAVRNAAEKYFGSAAGLKASVELEAGKTVYEIEGKKGKALKLSDTGQIVEEEKV
jgi:uncharacterized membrane protein YkoI